MVEQEESSKPGKESRLTARQLEVLNQLAEGKPAAPEEGKWIDLTLNSLLKRGLIETVAAASPGEPAQYRVTKPGMILLDSRATTAGRSIEKSSSIVAEDESADEVEESIEEKEESSPEVEKPRPPGRHAARAPQAKGDGGRGVASVRVKKPKFRPVVESIVWVRDQDGSTIEVDHWVRKVMPETEEALLSVRVGQNYKEISEPFHWSRIVPHPGNN
jgi:hypothetical protein